VFERPRAFDLERPNLSRSLSFGSGAHLCLGISLARMQLRVAARKAAQRLRDLQLAVPVADIRYVPNVALLAMESLPLTFAKGGRK
jgi:cytochrome P450